jgi:hypothetical protein
MSRQKRIEEYSKPASDVWWDGRSNKEAIDRWEKRASKNSKLAPRAKGGSTELPTTGPVKLHETHVRPGDPRAEAKADHNHIDVNSLYAKGIRRDA